MSEPNFKSNMVSMRRRNNVLEAKSCRQRTYREKWMKFLSLLALVFNFTSTSVDSFIQRVIRPSLNGMWIHDFSSNSKFSSTLFSSSLSPSDEEQAMEAIRSLADFHQGEWRGKAKSFTVTPDIAAGVVQRKTSPEYNVVVKLAVTDEQQFSLAETISWDEHNKMAFRSLPVYGTDFDVDAVDASYSLDTTKAADFPSILSGTEKECQFLIEHCIATGENKRSRCFVLYGTDESLIRVVVSNEERIQDESRPTNGVGNSKQNTEGALTARDLLEMKDDVDRLVDRIVSKMDGGNGSDSSPSSTPIEPSILPQKNDINSNRMDRLSESLSKTEGGPELTLHEMSLLELSSGVWLGDTIIRETPGVVVSPTEFGGRGFASAQNVEKDSWKQKVTRRFGRWTVGVQKIAWRWMWNFGEEIRQVNDVGKALGSPLDESVTKSLAGNVCVDESLSRRIPREERMVYVDWSQNDSVGFLLGSSAIQVPRYINFDPSSSSASRSLNKPFFTEFAVFQSSEKKSTGSRENDSSLSVDAMMLDGDGEGAPELICSKISRLYNFEGKLKQGCSSFFTFKRFGGDDTDS